MPRKAKDSRLQQELLEQTYKMGAYRQFYIYDPKKRLISAAPYRDCVVQDVKSYFASIDHDILYGFILRKIKDPRANEVSRGTN